MEFAEEKTPSWPPPAPVRPQSALPKRRRAFTLTKSGIMNSRTAEAPAAALWLPSSTSPRDAALATAARAAATMPPAVSYLVPPQKPTRPLVSTGCSPRRRAVSKNREARVSRFAAALRKRLAVCDASQSPRDGSPHEGQPLQEVEADEKTSTQSRWSVSSHPWHSLQRLGTSVVNSAPLQSFMAPLDTAAVAHTDVFLDDYGALHCCRASDVLPSGLPSFRPLKHLGAATPRVTATTTTTTVVSNGHFQQQVDEIATMLYGEPSSSFLVVPLLDNADGSSHQRGTASDAGDAAIPAWRRFSTMAALYLALGTAHVCDASLPVVSAYRCSVQTLRSLYARAPADPAMTHSLGRLPALDSLLLPQDNSCCPADTPFISGEDEQQQQQPQMAVAVLIPTATKGTSRVGRDGYLRMRTQSFSDAEVFQLLLLQLVFRAFFDVRFPAMLYRDEDTSVAHTRTDYIGVLPGTAQALAYRHPTRTEEWVLFPAHSRVLLLLNLQEAVIPTFASPEQLRGTAVMPLFGATRGDVAAQGKTGRLLLRWARTQRIGSPREAYRALLTLFEIAAVSYGCDRAAVGAASVPPRIFYTDDRTVTASLTAQSQSLSLFFVSSEDRVWPEKVVLASALRETLGATSDPNAAPAETAGAADEEAAPGVKNYSFAIPAPPPITTATAATTTEGETPSRTAGAEDNSETASGSEEIFKASFSVLAPTEPTTAAAAAAVVSGASASTSGKPPGSAEAAEFVVPMTSRFTQQESLVVRWRHYTMNGDVSMFDGLTDGITVDAEVGRGGSGIVYRGTYGTRKLPVAVKMFVIPDGMATEDYIRESLTDVSFFVLLNQLDDFEICSVCRAHDFIVSERVPEGVPDADANAARRGADPSTTKLCYLITDLMDGVLGRFLTPDDSEYDSFYDTIVCSPLHETELFQLLFFQLVAKSLFDWRVLDVMLNGQLRGDNIGYRYAHSARQPVATDDRRVRRDYDGIILAYHFDADDRVRYLRFPSDLSEHGKTTVLRLIYFIDLGQGMQPNVQALSDNHYIGQTLVDSCVQDDGFGRYWPLDELYCKYIHTTGGELAERVVEWGAQVRMRSYDDTVKALQELFALYEPTYGIDAPSEEAVKRHLCLCWSPLAVQELKKAYVYRVD